MKQILKLKGIKTGDTKHRTTKHLSINSQESRKGAQNEIKKKLHYTTEIQDCSHIIYTSNLKPIHCLPNHFKNVLDNHVYYKS